MNGVLIIRIILGILILCLFITLFKLHKVIKLERRIGRYSLKIDKQEDASYFELLWDKYQKFTKKYNKNERLIKYSKNYEKYISVGEGPNAVQFIINKLVIAIMFVILVIISYAIQGKLVGFIGLIFSFTLGYYIYDIYLIINKKRREKKIKNDMLRAVIIMNNAFKAGKSTLQASEIASRDLPKPISKEFKKIYEDISYGLSIDVAFTRFAKRVNLEEANYIASSLTILNKTGGNIINVFTSIERTLFDKKKLEEDLKNSTAASNLVVKVLMIIPFLFILVIYLISPTYFNSFFESVLGYIILSIIIIMFAIYVFLLNKIMKVKV